MVDVLAFIVTYIVFGAIGYFTSGRFKKALTVTTFIVLLVATIVSQAIFPTARLIGIFEFNIYIGPSLQAFLAGMLLGRTIRAIRTADQPRA